MKEEILKEFDKKYPNTTLYQVQQFHIVTGHTERRNILISGDIKKFLSDIIDKAISQTREETIRECITTIISKRGCRSHEPENCNVCKGRDEAIKSLNKLKK